MSFWGMWSYFSTILQESQKRKAKQKSLCCLDQAGVLEGNRSGTDKEVQIRACIENKDVYKKEGRNLVRELRNTSSQSKQGDPNK